MELGGVGSILGCLLLVGRDLAATAAKLSLPLMKAPPRGLGMSTEAVLPANAIAMLEALITEAIWFIEALSCFSVSQKYESADVRPECELQDPLCCIYGDSQSLCDQKQTNSKRQRQELLVDPEGAPKGLWNNKLERWRLKRRWMEVATTLIVVVGR